MTNRNIAIKKRRAAAAEFALRTRENYKRFKKVDESQLGYVICENCEKMHLRGSMYKSPDTANFTEFICGDCMESIRDE